MEESKVFDQFIIPDEVIGLFHDFYKNAAYAESKEVATYGRLSFNKVILKDNLDKIARRCWGAPDAFLLLLDGKVINESHLYRKGGLFSYDPKHDLLFELNRIEFEFDGTGEPTGTIKQTPVILNQKGKEMMDFQGKLSYENRSIVERSCLAVIGGRLINVLNKETYGKLLLKIDAGDSLYVELMDDTDLKTSRNRKVLKINKATGGSELLHSYRK